MLPIARAAAQVAPSASPIDSLKAKNLEVRRGAATKVRLSDRDVQRKALPVLIDLLMTEKDGQVRLAVLDTVAGLGLDAASAVPALVHTLRTDYGGLGKEELHQDYRSAIALAAIGKPAVEGLRGLLKERKESVRADSPLTRGRCRTEGRLRVRPLRERGIEDGDALVENHCRHGGIEHLEMRRSTVLVEREPIAVFLVENHLIA